VGDEARVARAFAASVARGAFGPWDEVVLPAMAADGPMTGPLVAALQEAGFAARREQTAEAPYIPLPATWEKYLQLLPKKHRYVVVHSQRDLEAWAAGGIELHEVRAPGALAEGKRVLTTLHNERWQAAATVGAFARPRFARFHDEVLPQLQALGKLELLWLSVRGQPVAAMYNVLWNNKVYFYQHGRKLDLPRRLRPGIVLIGLAIRRAIEAGRREFDFLPGQSLYKHQLALTNRPVVQLRVARRG